MKIRISLKPFQYLELTVTQNYILHVDGMKGFLLSAVIIMHDFFYPYGKKEPKVKGLD
jgi:hypothetical protein